MQFEFSTASKIIFGSGKFKTISELAAQLGKRLVIISGTSQKITEDLHGFLESQGLHYSTFQVKHEPTIDILQEDLAKARASSPDVIIGIGGGSAMDSAKVISAMLNNPGDITDYLEVIGASKPLLSCAIPLIAIPTTSGTGSEVTRNAVIGSPEHHVKVSMRSPYLMPKISLVDPELMITLPPSKTATTGLDTLTQLIEPYTSTSANPFTDALCLEGLHRVAHSFLTTWKDGSNLPAREDMALASLFSGMALANAKLGAVHGLAGPIGGEISAPHGAICASLLPHVMEANLTAISTRMPDNSVLEKYATIGKILTGNPAATAEAGVQWIRDFNQTVDIAPLSMYGLTYELFDKIIEKSLVSSSMKGNPITLSVQELRNILSKVM